MPEITRFYGIVIKMYFGDHLPPHFHAIYGEYVGMFNINTLEMIEGDLPKRAREMIIEWASKYQNELLDIWESQKFIRLPGLE
ncbi:MULTISPECIES: type II toxin-antitoxin system toxin DhiT [Thermoanaerobacterium]|jgi:hypothetical protein|uniref:Transcriptional regulator n=1 Tax=Thermoanaerobacterium thermosaccharolyticum (strain ATCC 7956 / DSM 571 / NCIMB 9385 / NCA 3814 / NCTC 13789 / WDCM 00135 / 2032) TaxID=580327 RepID=D9TQQ7_THETC|nr:MULTISPECIES: DUF4160 domain-containing protein [Thermoanaerobacterium]ADL67883.1 conserved hypothetical protein [Thermoanaerobacterium thermosaccharolyticum DSM 571]KAA5806923.1 DUF4160 domain-containing protein [Thermoanaerobacterium thermosaccharolyticum]TCW42549.1 uncharacterized protein DUF4160 [Thermohydrogenium kirishiense]WKV09426.1 DUF4160 domain-containing protein [Thermoanaerobacterium sp. CMT5567-10]